MPAGVWRSGDRWRIPRSAVDAEWRQAGQIAMPCLFWKMRREILRIFPETPQQSRNAAAVAKLAWCIQPVAVYVITKR